MQYVRPFFELLWLVAVFVALTAIGALPVVRKLVSRAMRRLGTIAHWRGAGPVVVGLAALIAGAIPTWIGHTVPISVPDEFSYVLAADTFLHGRLSNPSHQHWRHFQTTHILSQPTYASKYPPGQGIVLAGGGLLGSMRLGAYGMVALACAMTCWALRPCLPRRWCIIAGLLLAAHPWVFMWGQTFWGGGVALLGGALVTGAALRISRRPTWQQGIVLAAGLAILANSRPFEGMLFAIAILSWLTARSIRRDSMMAMARWVVLPGVIVAIPVGAWMLYYNKRVTGDALRTPYAEHSQQYTIAPNFFWQSPNRNVATDVPPHLKVFHSRYEFQEYERVRTLPGFLLDALRKVAYIGRATIWPLPLAIIVFVGIGRAVKRYRAARLALVIGLGIIAIHICCTPWLRYHYLAMLAPLYAALVVLCIIESSRLIERRFQINRLAPAIATAMLVVFVIASCFKLGNEIKESPTQDQVRNRFINFVQSKVPGEHLIFVDFTLGPQRPWVWVWNSADIDAQPVVFAHVLDPKSDTQLEEYFNQRSVWLLTISDLNFNFKPKVLRHEPYPATSMKPAS